jgi:ribosomal protein S18 acetylase RimI-like enzyme
MNCIIRNVQMKDYHSFEKVIKEKKNLDGIELQVNAKNKAAYEMYCNYGFTEKSINMELL